MDYKDLSAVLFVPLILIVMVVTYASFEAPLIDTFNVRMENDTFIGLNVTGTGVDATDTLNFLDKTGIINDTTTGSATLIKIWTNNGAGGYIKTRQLNIGEWNYTTADTILVTNKTLNNTQLLAEYTYREGSAYNSAVKSKNQGWNALSFTSVLPIILVGVFILLVVMGVMGAY